MGESRTSMVFSPSPSSAGLGPRLYWLRIALLSVYGFRGDLIYPLVLSSLQPAHQRSVALHFRLSFPPFVGLLPFLVFFFRLLLRDNLVRGPLRTSKPLEVFFFSFIRACKGPCESVDFCCGFGEDLFLEYIS